jgi:hypothetical protein
MIRYGKKVLQTFDTDAEDEFFENCFQPTTPPDAA